VDEREDGFCSISGLRIPGYAVFYLGEEKERACELGESFYGIEMALVVIGDGWMTVRIPLVGMVWLAFGDL